MHEKELKSLLARVQAGTETIGRALEQIKALPFENLGFARLDHHRALRLGFPEVVFCQGKTAEQVRLIVARMVRRHGSLLLTRVTPGLAQDLQAQYPDLEHNSLARTLARRARGQRRRGLVLVVSAGTADLPVAEEAAVTAEVMGSRVERVYDAGVAGLHRLAPHLRRIQRARCLVAVAGMEGALPSVLGGLASCPVIAVPTSVGYGTHLGGWAPLVTMLNSCASNVAVVNIDNGFSAGFIAALINRRR